MAGTTSGGPSSGALGRADLTLASPRGRLVVAAMVLGSTATFVTATVVNVALPRIDADLDASLTGLQWVLNGYLLALAALVLPAGSLGDLIGRRRVFVGGAALFALGSVGCAAAPTVPILVLARMVQGVGAAAMTPTSLAIVDASFRDEDRSKAVGAWASGSALATSAGPFLGGWMVDAASWRWIFLLPLPLVALSVLLAVRHVPETRDPRSGRHLDGAGAALAVLATGSLVFALIEGPSRGWDELLVVASIVVAVATGAGFVARQRSARDPMLPLSLFADRQFSGVTVYTLVVYTAIGGGFIFTAIHFQTTLGYSALEAGAALVPAQVLMLVLSPVAGALSGEHGPRWLVTSGALLAAGGFALLSMVDAGDTYPVALLPGVLSLGLGLATLVAPLTAAVFAAVPDRDVGVASAVNNAVARSGSLLAAAVLPGLAGATSDLGGGAFTEPYRRAMLVCAGLAAAGAAIGVTTIGRCVRLRTPIQPSPTAGCSQRSLPEESEAA